MVTETLHHRHPHHGGGSSNGHSPSMSKPTSDSTTMMMNGVAGSSSSSNKDVGSHSNINNNNDDRFQRRRRRKRRSSSRNKTCTNNILSRCINNSSKRNNNKHLSSNNLTTNFKLGIWPSRLLLMFVAIIYSTNFACVRYLETSDGKTHDPAEISFCRFFVSALVCLPILYQNLQHLEVIKSGIEVGFWCSVHYVCQANSLEYIAAGKCSFICALEVVTVPLFAGFFLKKPIRPMSLVSAAIAIFGVGVLEQLIPLPGFISSHVSIATAAINHPVGPARFMGVLGKGDMLALVQPLAFGYAMMRIEYHVERFAHIPNRVLTLTAAQCITVFLSTFLWVLWNNHGSMPNLSYMEEPHRVLILFWTGAITTVLAIVLQGIALQTASATDAALIFSGDPLWSSLFAGWLLNELPTLSTYVGGAFILTGCVVGSIASAKTDAAETHHNISNTNNTMNNNKQRRKLKLKDSFIHDSDQESLLPHSYDSTADMSMESINDVRQFPVSV